MVLGLLRTSPRISSQLGESKTFPTTSYRKPSRKLKRQTCPRVTGCHLDSVTGKPGQSRKKICSPNVWSWLNPQEFCGMADRAPEGSVGTDAFDGRHREIQHKMKQELRTCQAFLWGWDEGTRRAWLGPPWKLEDKWPSVMRLTKEKQVLWGNTEKSSKANRRAGGTVLAVLMTDAWPNLVRKESLGDLTLIWKPWVRTQLKVQASQLGENSWWYFCQHTRHLCNDCLSKGINRFIFLEKQKGKLTFVREFLWSIYKQRRIFIRHSSVEQTFHLRLAHTIKAAEYYCSEGTGLAFHHLVASVWQAHRECAHSWGRLAVHTPQQLVSPISSFGSLCCRTSSAFQPKESPLNFSFCVEQSLAPGLDPLQPSDAQRAFITSGSYIRA